MGKKSRRNRGGKNKPPSSNGHSGESIARGFRRHAEQLRNEGISEAFAKMALLERHSLSQQKAIIRQSLLSIGTDCDKNDADPTGDGDQSRIETSEQADLARELYAIGGDIHQTAVESAFSAFGMNSVIGNLGGIRDMIKKAEKIIQTKQTEPWYCSSDGKKEMMSLLEFRDTSMRLSPILLIVSAGKNVADQPFMDHKETAKFLLKNGANPYAKDVLGKTVAHYGAGAFATDMTLDVVDMCVSAAESFYLFGKEVELHSLEAEEMNGLKGVAGGFDPDSGRRVVYLSEDRREVWIKPKNIRLVADDENEDQPNKMLLDVQDRMGSVSLIEVVMQDRIDVAKFLLAKHSTSIYTEDMDGISPMKMSTRGGQMASTVCKIIADVARKEGKESRDIKKKASCANCKKDLGEGGYWCSKCDSVSYCGEECQIAHWKNGHKAECKKMKAIVKGVKLAAPSGPYAFSATISLVSGKSHKKGSYHIPDGVGVDEKFVVKVQGMGEMVPIMAYDKTRTCDFTIAPGQPGFKEVLTEIEKEMAWGGRKTFMKASFDDSGDCTIYPATAGVKEKYTW